MAIKEEEQWKVLATGGGLQPRCQGLAKESLALNQSLAQFPDELWEEKERNNVRGLSQSVPDQDQHATMSLHWEFS